MGQIQLTTSLILIGLFSVAIIGFAMNFAIDNDAPVSISDDAELTDLYSKTSGNLSGFNTASESQYQSIIETTVAPESGVSQSVGSFAVTPANSVGVTKNILSVGYKKIFGSDSGFNIFLVSLIGIIVFMLGLYLYKTLRGIPD